MRVPVVIEAASDILRILYMMESSLDVEGWGAKGGLVIYYWAPISAERLGKYSAPS